MDRGVAAAHLRGLVGAGRRVRLATALVLLCNLPAHAVQAPDGSRTLGRRQAAATPTAAVVAGSITQRIRTLEAEGRARPGDAAEALDRLLPEIDASAAERLELLTVQGLVRAAAAQAPQAEAAAAQLAAWGREVMRPHAALAGAAAQLVRAASLASSGELQQADALLANATAHLADDLDPVVRYRFFAKQTYVMQEVGKLEAAVRLGHQALALADRQPALWRRSEARTVLAKAYIGAKQLEQARRWVNESLALASEVEDWVSLGHAHNLDGILADSAHDQPAERRAFEAAIECAHRAGSKRDEAHFLANLADFFLQTADYETALTNAERALVLTREVADRDTETIALTNIGLAHVSLRRFELGERYVREAIAIDERRGSVAGMADTWREFGRYLERADAPAAAVAAYHQYRRLATQLSQVDQQKAILEMQEQYEADSRSRALALLDRENDVKAAQLRRRHLQQRLWLAAAAVCLLTLGASWLFYRRLCETNRLLARSNRKLAEQVERDPLTGLANRRHFDAAMHRLADDGKLSGTVLLIDIDHFKRVNDLYGHAAGDAVLVEVARRLAATLRDDDLLVRWGGEEFLVVMQNLTEAQVERLAQRLLDALDQQPVVAGGRSIPVTGSIGFATFPIGPCALRVPWARAVDLVDTAMYLAKAHGRNRAYGVGLPQARDVDSLDAVTRGLEAAWQDGRATLTQLRGGQVLAAAG